MQYYPVEAEAGGRRAGGQVGHIEKRIEIDNLQLVPTIFGPSAAFVIKSLNRLLHLNTYLAS